jgi:hypothetical protein
MGGFNSGRHGSKITTQGSNTLDVRKWQRDRLLISGYRFDSSWTRNGQPNDAISVIVNTDSVNLIYRHGGEFGQDMNYPVMIDWTPCNYGGRRAWWLCPCCGRRVAILYSGKMFACRQCHRLDYESTRTAPDSKPYERADNVRRQLGWCAGVANPAGNKPKGMHWKTFERMLNQLNSHSIAAMQSTNKLLKRITERLN